MSSDGRHDELDVSWIKQEFVVPSGAAGDTNDCNQTNTSSNTNDCNQTPSDDTQLLRIRPTDTGYNTTTWSRRISSDMVVHIKPETLDSNQDQDHTYSDQDRNASCTDPEQDEWHITPADYAAATAVAIRSAYQAMRSSSSSPTLQYNKGGVLSGWLHSVHPGDSSHDCSDRREDQDRSNRSDTHDLRDCSEDQDRSNRSSNRDCRNIREATDCRSASKDRNSRNRRVHQDRRDRSEERDRRDRSRSQGYSTSGVWPHTPNIGKKTVYIGNLPYKATKSDVKNMLHRCGHVKVMHIAGDFAIVKFDCIQDAERAINEMDGSLQFGRHINMHMSSRNSRSRQKSSNSSRRAHLTNSSSDSEGEWIGSEVPTRNDALFQSATLTPQHTVQQQLLRHHHHQILQHQQQLLLQQIKLQLQQIGLQRQRSLLDQRTPNVDTFSGVQVQGFAADQSENLDTQPHNAHLWQHFEAQPQSPQATMQHLEERLAQLREQQRIKELEQEIMSVERSLCSNASATGSVDFS